MSEQLKILYVAAEVAPFVKVGGLADVAGALPKALRELGHDIRVIMPCYAQVDAPKFGLRPALGGKAFAVPGSDEPATLFEAENGGVPVYFVGNHRYFGRDRVYGEPDDVERFLYFCRAALQAVQELGWQPDVVNCNDWHTAVIPHWLRTRDLLHGAASVVTIHNLAYQGGFDPNAFPREWIDVSRLFRRADGGVDLLSQGIHDADIVTTVSEQYAHEITTPEYGEGLQDLLISRINDLRGIVNGIDYDLFDPARDPAIAEHYTADSLEGKAACKLALQQEAGFNPSPRTPLIGMIGRLADQKGFDLVAEMLEPMLAETDVQVVLLGTGEPRYHDLFRALASRNRRQLAVYLAFDGALAQRIYAGSDMFLMPSRFEPCGLGQLISLRYGTVPVVRSTGGLADTVIDYQAATDRGTGFLFRRYHPVSLTITLGRAFEVYRSAERWQGLQRRAMAQDLSWDASAQRYVSAYREAVDRAQRRAAATAGC